MAKEKILVIEDDESIRELLKFNLEANGVGEVHTAGDGASGLEEAQRWLPDLIVLDLMLPEMDGLTVCRHLKNSPRMAAIPVVMLTAKSEESDIVLGLELGAVDYVTKPFSNRVLVARLRAHLRRAGENGNEALISYEGLALDLTSRDVKRDGQSIDLTYSEFEMLALFLRHPGRVFSRNQIVSRVKGDDYPVTDRAVDVQMVNLRRKLGEWGNHLETVRGVGYRLKPRY